MKKLLLLFLCLVQPCLSRGQGYYGFWKAMKKIFVAEDLHPSVVRTGKDLKIGLNSNEFHSYVKVKGAPGSIEEFLYKSTQPDDDIKKLARGVGTAEVNPSVSARTIKTFEQVNVAMYWKPIKNTMVGIKNVDVSINIPRNEKEYTNMFGRFNRAQYEEFSSLASKIESESNDRVHMPGTSDDFLDMFAATGVENRPLIVVGHSESQGLKFSSGEIIPFKELDFYAKAFNRKVVYLACNAGRYTDNPAPEYSLFYTDAIALANKIDNFGKDAADNDDLFEHEANKFIGAYGILTQSKKRLKLVAYSAGAGGGLYYFTQDKK